MTGSIDLVKEGPLGWLIFNNPSKLNALSEEMSQSGLAVMADLVADPAIRVIILRGAGSKAFISGGDISKFDLDAAPQEKALSDHHYYDLLKASLAQTSKPVLAMIHGYCLGGGMGMALGADIRLAASSAKLGIPAAKRALGYPWAHVKTLTDIVGPAVAKDILFSGRTIEANEALGLGLVNRVIATDALERETRAYALEIAMNAPLTIAAAKFAVSEVMKTAPDHEQMIKMAKIASDSEDFKEATRSFMEKRKPNFQGK